ncbi:hypothetical protein [Haladaptatus halobius]|uniref:hypothetical protein n=1 Tax=Haladaptatus halobius TaxID=2884875 RepID=UPI001D0B45B4|nr:hypothetical protein [Haladaptatus halobius]
MSIHASDANECPACGTEYDQQIIVERGDRWDDLFPGSPLDFFIRYRRRCTAPYDVDADRQLPERERAIYFHEK